MSQASQARMRRRGALVGLLGQDGLTLGRTVNRWVNDYYFRLHVKFIAALYVILVISVAGDIASAGGLPLNHLHLAIPVVLIPFIFYAAVHPILMLFFGAVWWVTGRGAWRERIAHGITGWWEFVIRMALFVFVFGGTRWIVPIHNYPMMGL